MGHHRQTYCKVAHNRRLKLPKQNKISLVTPPKRLDQDNCDAEVRTNICIGACQIRDSQGTIISA